MKISKEELAAILAAHALWLSSGCVEGARADLTGADLTGAYLSGAYLTRAYLRGADLRGAYLSGAYLTGAYLSGAYLTGANLTRAYLRGADLTGADLRDADLRDADLSGADLRDADLRDADLPAYAHCPQEGDFIAFKKLSGGVVAKLRVPSAAGRTSSLVGRKCRAEYVEVLELSEGEVGISCRDNKTEYRVGSTVRPDSYDPDPRVECTNGIHFFMAREEAEKY